jgi:hypothetical protein
MDDPLEVLLDEAIRHELNVSSLYFEFCQAFAEDSDFWWKLSVEEQGHAGLLRVVRKLLGAELEREILPLRAEEIAQSNRNLEELLEQIEHQPPSREDAFRIALGIETSTDGLIYEHALQPEEDSAGREIAQRIARDDRRHEERIRRRMRDQGIGEA